MPVPDTPIRGWDSIWRLCFHVRVVEAGRIVEKPLICKRKLAGYAEELKATGCVNVVPHGRRNNPTAFGWPKRIQAWIQLKFERGGL
ncbi:MAG: hypothetical protein KKE73_10860 [Proteobacteria bacterium]|nr:hypothetical protein [Pseudomonadota bacterium]